MVGQVAQQPQAQVPLVARPARVAVSKPMPSSVTRSSTPPAGSSTSTTSTRAACACFATLDRASRTTRYTSVEVVGPTSPVTVVVTVATMPFASYGAARSCSAPTRSPSARLGG